MFCGPLSGKSLTVLAAAYLVDVLVSVLVEILPEVLAQAAVEGLMAAAEDEEEEEGEGEGEGVVGEVGEVVDAYRGRPTLVSFEQMQNERTYPRGGDSP